MIGALLCRLGHHRWHYRMTFFGGWQVDGCARCPAIKEASEPYDHELEAQVQDRIRAMREAFEQDTLCMNTGENDG